MLFRSNPSPAKAVGALTAGLALLGGLAAFYLPGVSSAAGTRPRQRAALTGVLALAFAIYCLFTLKISGAAWDRIPLLPFVQFPWRMLGAASLCAALLAGALTARMGALAPLAAGSDHKRSSRQIKVTVGRRLTHCSSANGKTRVNRSIR